MIIIVVLKVRSLSCGKNLKLVFTYRLLFQTVYVDVEIAQKIEIRAKLQLPLVNFSYLDIGKGTRPKQHPVDRYVGTGEELGFELGNLQFQLHN